MMSKYEKERQEARDKSVDHYIKFLENRINGLISSLDKLESGGDGDDLVCDLVSYYLE